MKSSKKSSFQQYTDKGLQEVPEEIIVETTLELWLEDMMLAKFFCSPSHKEKLALGYMVSSGLITKAQDIELISVEESRITISTQNKSSLVRKFLQYQTQEVPAIYSLEQSNIDIHLDQIRKYSEVMKTHQKLHSRTGGAHGAMMVDSRTDEHLIVEDIGRLNTVDKVIGLAIDRKWNLSKSLLIVTGRLTSEMVLKTITAGIPLLASMAVATDKGIALAQDGNLTLCGSLKHDSFWVYNEGAIRLNQ